VASVGHAIVGMAAARFHLAARAAGDPLRSPRWRAAYMIRFAALGLLADADVILALYGVRYADPWGHRGATHSYAFATLVALAIGAACLFHASGRAFRTMAIAWFVLVSHPILDAMTDGGLGVAFFWPLSTKRYFLPWRPIPVAPLGEAFFGEEGLRVAATELAYFAPLLIYALWPWGNRAKPPPP
jgi:inner membrane protein